MVDLGVDGLTDVSLIGKGGTASVYKASTADGAVVAVKVFPGVWDDDRQRRFERELEAMSKLDQVDGVVKFFDHGRTSSGVTFFTMPFYANGSLQNALNRDGVFCWEKAVGYARQILLTLQQTHTLGVYHRDLKPANILLDDAGCPVIADFGITEIADGRSVSTMAAYTPGFCPPEALTKGRKNIDGASCDIYALGSTLWSLLTGKQPFVNEGDEGTDPMVLLNRLTTEPLSVVSSAPVWVNDVIAFATAKTPDQRYVSVNDLLHDFDNEGVLAVSRRKTFADTIDAGAGEFLLTVPRQSSASETTPIQEQVEPVEPAGRGVSKKALLLLGAVILLIGLSGAAVWGINRILTTENSDSELADSDTQGVTSVTNQLIDEEGSADPETPKKNATPVAAAEEKTQPETKLPTLAQGINVEEDGETVLLTGYVANQAESTLAEETITDAGSYTVQNDLKVLEPEVLTVLESAEVANPEVTGKETEITVTGSVATDEEKQEVVEAAKRVPGVTTIIDQIQVNAIDVINSLPQVQFRTGSSQLLSESFADLDRAAELLQNVPNKNIEIVGYTNTQEGDPSFQLILSQQRAETVRQYLISQGVEASTLIAVGKGGTTEFGQGTSDEALAANRKVLFIEK